MNLPGSDPRFELPEAPVRGPSGDAPGCVSDWIGWAVKHLGTEAAVARPEAALLMGQVLGCERAGVATRERDAIKAEAALRFAGLVERRRQGEPVAYLLGRRGFWTLELEVSPAVLVPRPETELLVEWALQWLVDLPAPRIADLGTGSGAIALALASERPGATIVATDASEAALEQARANARSLQLATVDFRLGDWCQPLGEERFDLIVSNPPYIAEGDPHLTDLVFEPRRALVSGPEGLVALRAIAASAPRHLHAGGGLLVEHGCSQGEAVRALLISRGFSAVETRRDLAGLERATLGIRA